MKLSSLSLGLTLTALAACGGATNNTPASSPTTTSAPTPAAAEPAAKAVAPVEPARAPVEVKPAAPVAEPEAEKCNGGWVCVKVSLATGKVEKRDTKLMGDPKIETTWSKQSDGRTATFEQFSKGPVELTLRRKPNNKNEVVVKLAKGGNVIVIDKKDGTVDDFTHVGAIASEQDGTLLVDLRYMR